MHFNSYRKHQKSLTGLAFLIFPVLLYSSKVFSAQWSGRFTLGSYASIERFSDNLATGSDKNDFQTISTRLYLKGERLADTDWEFVSDLRDKHDFFDKLNAEKLTLESRNDFQVRQISVKKSNPNEFWGAQFGRFPVFEAGAAYVDGILLENNFTNTIFSSYFAGMNPQKRERSYLQTDPKATIYGVTFSYRRPRSSWADIYSNSAFVTEMYEKSVDRNYIFQNLIYRWGPDSRLIALLYYDLVPQRKIQNGNLIWQNGWGDSLSSDVTLTTLDVIEYSRRQEVLETLPSSPYQDASLRLTYKFHRAQDRIYLLQSTGRRSLDGLARTVTELGYAKSGFWGPQWDGYLVLGTRRNFTSQDTLSRLGVGRFGRKWEMNLDLEVQKHVNVDGTVTNPKIGELSLSYFVSRQAFWTLSGQSASDEKVKIYSAFFKFGYRFGSRELPPLRDGAPPRGPL